MYDAEVNHCLSFEQVSDEIIEQYKITSGNFDTITECEYTIPSFTDIGKLYRILIEDCAEAGKEVDELINIFFLSLVIRYLILKQIFIIRTLVT